MDYPRALLAALGVVVVVALAVAGSTTSAAFGTYNPSWDGASDLRERADTAGAETTIARNTTVYEDLDPNGTVAVVLSPDEAYGPADTERLRSFVRGGGTLLVADDYGPHSNALLADVGATATVDGQPLRDERYNYRSPGLPVAGNVSNHSLVAGVDEMTLNHGTAVEPGGATILVSSSEYAYLDTNGNDELDDAEAVGTYPVATVEDVGDGRVVALGDASALINVMLERDGNDRFVRNLFDGADRVVLDYSHAADLPPLSIALLAVRESVTLQALIGLVGLAAIGLWTRGVGGRFRRGSEPDRRTPVRTTESELASYVRRRHPDWDEERVRRVIRGVIRRRGESDDDG